jgi:hypothetical protein
MFQVLILITVILLIYVITKMSRNSAGFISSNQSEMVKCSACGLNFPDNESVKNGESLFCSSECSSKNGI